MAQYCLNQYRFYFDFLKNKSTIEQDNIFISSVSVCLSVFSFVTLSETNLSSTCMTQLFLFYSCHDFLSFQSLVSSLSLSLSFSLSRFSSRLISWKIMNLCVQVCVTKMTRILNCGFHCSIPFTKNPGLRFTKLYYQISRSFSVGHC